MSVVYIVFARFETLSFDRRERYVRPIAKLMKTVTEKLEMQIALLLDEIKNVGTKIFLSSTFKMLCFIVASVVLIIGSAVYLFLSVIRKLFSNLLIGWKALSLGSLSIMFSKFIGLVEQLAGVLYIPPSLVRTLLYPFMLIYKLADLFKIEDFYSLLSVTCQGAKAPIELFVDCFVLGVAILFIKSNYNFLWAMTFQELNRLTVIKFWIQGKKILSLKFALAVITFALSSTNSFITMLRFFLSYVNFGAFFVNDHVMHFLSKACIGIEGFQNQELLLVNSTSVLIWWLILPMLYSTAEIVCPKGGFTTSTTTSMASIIGSRITSFVVYPLPAQEMIDSDDNISSIDSIESVVSVSEYNENDNASINTMSVIVSDYNDSDASSGISIGNVIVSEESEFVSDNVGSILISEFDEKSDAESQYERVSGDRDDIQCIGTKNWNVMDISRPAATLVVQVLAHNAQTDADVINSRTVMNGNSISAGVAGLRRYAWSYLSLVFGVDLFFVHLIHAYVAYRQKGDKLESLRQLRAHVRWIPTNNLAFSSEANEKKRLESIP